MQVAKRHWFLFGLLLLIPLGFSIGPTPIGDTVEPILTQLPAAWCTAAILFLMSFTLNSRRLLDSLKRPMPVIFSCVVNQLFIPLLSVPLLLLQKSPDMKVGLLIVGSVPCTMAAASVWTRRAGGNDAVSLLVTLVTNGLCFVITPAWLAAGSQWLGTARPADGLEFGAMVQALTLAALIPAIGGQSLRLWQKGRLFADERKPLLGVAAQSIILLLVFVSAFRGGRRFSENDVSNNLRHGEFAFAWACCVFMHLTAMVVAWWGSGAAGFSEDDRRACVMAGSQKTLPIGILVSQSTGMPLSLLPMLMYHASQLFVDTWVADWLTRRTADTSERQPETQTAAASDR